MYVLPALMTIDRFTSSDHWVFQDGVMYVIAGDQLPEGMYDPVDLKGKPVVIDGKICRVRGVGTFAIPRSADNPYRSAFELFVKSKHLAAQRQVDLG